MKKEVIIVVLGVIACTATQQIQNEINNKIISQENYLEIKAKTSSWEPYKPEDHPFKGLSDEEIKMKMGLKMDHPDMGISQLVKQAKGMMRAFGFNLD